MKEITLCLTSCNRWNLLEKTIDSFLKLNNYPIKEYLIHEDSNNEEIYQKIQNKYGYLFKILKPEKNVGLLKSIDNLYELVTTEYIFHLEDDWEFKGNPDFMQESLNILENNKNIHQIWIRSGIPNDWLEPKNNNNFRMVKKSHYGDWTGFSFNPGLRRLSDYKLMFPEGYSKHHDKNKNSALNEHDCNLVTINFNYRAALLNNSACKHIGENQSTYK